MSASMVSPDGRVTPVTCIEDYIHVKGGVETDTVHVHVDDKVV